MIKFIIGIVVGYFGADIIDSVIEDVSGDTVGHDNDQ